MNPDEAKIIVKRKVIAALLFGLAVIAFIYFLSYEPSAQLERKGTHGGILDGLDLNSLISLLTALVSLAASVITFVTTLTAHRKP